MKLKSLIIVVLLTLLYTTNLNAQSHSSTSSRKWKGIDLEDWVTNHHGVNQSSPVYLYNVGTGRFMIDGGDWGMEGRLFYDDFGRKVSLINYSTNGIDLRIEPGITENSNPDKRQLICNIPTVTRDNISWAKSNTEMSVTTVFDGHTTYGKWNFVRVEPESNTDSYTYYLYQQHNTISKNYLNTGVQVKNIMFYLGAAYGEYCSDGTERFSNGEENNKGCGYYVNVDDDRSCWTSAGSHQINNKSPKGNQDFVTVNGDSVTIDELYQWRIISEEEFTRVLNEEVIGINPSISSLVPDRDFTRNSKHFFDEWTVTPASTAPAQNEGRYGYTWGFISNNNKQQPYYNESWDAPVRLKKLFGNNNNENNRIKIAKYGFMSFEGIGTVHATFELPHPGWYQIDAAALNFSTDPSHFGYMYAQAGYVSEATWTDDNDLGNPRLGYSRVKLIQKTDIDGLIQEYEADGIFKDVKDYLPTSNSKNNEYSNIAVGCVLTRKNEDIRHKLWIYVNPEQFNQGGDNKKLTIGFGKQNAKKKKGGVNNQKTYYYDEDWLCVDDIRVTYMGLAPAFFYEEEENLDYLIYDGGLIDDRPSAQPDGIYSGALCLERKMTKNEWNSFSFPIPLTGEQMRLAFGNDAELLELDGVYNNEAGKPYLINFKTVDLKQPVTDINAIPMVVKPGKFYLLKPTLDPVTGEDPMKRTTEYYELGRNFFAAESQSQQKPELGIPEEYSHSHTVIDVDQPYVRNKLSSEDGNNDGFSYVSYVRTRGMYNPDGTRKNPSEFLTNGVYDASKIENLQDIINPGTEYLFVPKGGYAIANKDGKKVFMEVNKDTPIKGFRGWLTLAHSIFPTDDEANEIKVTVNNSLDDDEIITSIDGYELKPQKIMNGTDVYDLSGRKVGQFGETSLQRGFYIVAGKKIFVK